MTKQILIAGFGGQGVLFAGKFLAYKGLTEGKQVSWLPSYGPEMRGGTANCSIILSDDPILFLINSYTTGLSMTVLENILNLTVNKKYKGFISSDELGIKEENSELILPCGIYARWEKEKYDE